MNRKRRNRIIGIALTAAACVVIVAAGILLSDSPVCKLEDADGNLLASVSTEDGAYIIECADEDWAYADMAFHEAVELLASQEGISEEVAQKKLVKEEASIRTFLQSEIQDALSEAVLQSKEAAASNSAGAVCNLDGEMIACYSHSAEQDGINYVTYPTWAGSTMKPLSVYGPAIEEDVICWSTLTEDSPYMEIEDEDGNRSGWPVNTVDYTYEEITAAQALKESNNAVAVKILNLFGLENSLDWLENSFGYTVDEERSLLETVGSDEILDNVALGYLEAGVTVSQMLENYQVFAAGGMRRTLCTVNYIEGKNQTWEWEEEEPEQVFSEETAYIVNRMLKEVISEGGTGEAAMIEDVDLCGKTGTSSNYRDNWFIGMTPEYLCAVWYSCENAEIHTQNESVSICAQVVESIPGQEGLEFVCPGTVEKLTYCTKTGLLAGECCEETEEGYYKKGSFTEVCDCKETEE